MTTLKTLKVSLIKEYDIKDLEKVKTIIKWQIYQNFVVSTMKID